MTTTATLAGLFDFALAAFHVAFWRLFGWPRKLAQLDPVNRGILQVANLALITLFSLAGAILTLQTADAIASATGRWLLAGLALFWLARAAVQPLFFSMRHPVSIVLTVLFVAGAILHALPLLPPRG